jgi:hypothetical protein
LVFAFVPFGAVERFLFCLGARAGASTVVATGEVLRGMSFHQFRYGRISIVATRDGGANELRSDR